jgi:hypothetical protein
LGSATDFYTFALWKTDPWLLLTNDEHIALSCCKGVIDRVFDVNDVKASIMAFTMRYNTNTTHIATACDHGDDSSVELDKVGDLAGCEVYLDCIVDFDDGVWVSNPKLSPALSVS